MSGVRFQVVEVEFQFICDSYDQLIEYSILKNIESVYTRAHLSLKHISSTSEFNVVLTDQYHNLNSPKIFYFVQDIQFWMSLDTNLEQSHWHSSER